MGISIPKELRNLISEARACCTMHQSIADYSLCRTSIEVSIRHIIEKGKIKNFKTGKEFDFGGDYCVKDLILLLSTRRPTYAEETRNKVYSPGVETVAAEGLLKAEEHVRYAHLSDIYCSE